MFGKLCALLGVASALFSPSAVAEDSERSHGSVPLRTHSLAAPFLDTDLQSRWFDYGGDTIIRADRYIRLASEHPGQSGWIFSRVPLTATNWEIELEFQIHGKSNVLFGDGMGLFLTKERAEQGPVFGFRDKFEGLGVFIDTYKNNRPGQVFPYVMGMLGDGQTAYDKPNDGKANDIGGCSARGIRNANHPTKLRLTYFAEQSLTLDVMYKKDEEWTNCFEVQNAKLPAVTYLGLTAETGELSDNFDIIKLETRNLYSKSSGSTGSSKSSTSEKKGGKAKGRGNARGNAETSKKSGGSWMWFFLKLILFFIAVVGAYVGWTMYRAHKRDRF